MNQSWNRLSLTIMGAGLAALAGAAVLFVLMLTGTVGKGYSGPGTSPVIEGDISQYLTPVATPTSAVPPSEAPIAHILIPDFDVNAPVIVRGVDADGVMEPPDGPVNVAWYNFSAKPGFGSNAVFSGHVDYIDYGPAVFWSLKDLEAGDVIQVALEDGTVYDYKVASREVVGAEASPDQIAQIVGPTEQEIITLITCSGPFNASIGQYTERTVVRAERVYETAAASSTPAPSAFQ